MAKFLLSFITIISLCLPSLAFQEIQISFRPVENQPYIVGAPEINIDAEEFTTVILKMKSPKGGTARLFWATNFDPRMNEPKSVWFFLRKSSDPKEYVFNLRSQNPYWAGFVGQLLVFPEGGPEGIEVESARAVPSSLTTNLRSGWQEFWGPRGRLVIGSTINTIQSSNLFGQSIFVYIYLLIGLISIAFLGWETYQWNGLKKKPPFDTVIASTGKFAIITALIFWGLLELSNLCNNWLQIKADWQYVGKSYEQKLILANAGDFYPFIEFCENNLSLNTKYDLRAGPIYSDIKTKYYLYPRQFSTTEAEYLVVYEMAVDPATAAKYSLFRTFRDKAYIMKKREK